MRFDFLAGWAIVRVHVQYESPTVLVLYVQYKYVPVHFFLPLAIDRRRRPLGPSSWPRPRTVQGQGQPSNPFSPIARFAGRARRFDGNSHHPQWNTGTPTKCGRHHRPTAVFKVTNDS